MSGLVKRKFFQSFAANGTYTVPSGVTMLWIECIGQGGGGGGGGSGAATNASGGGGGGGASMTWGVFNAPDLSATLAIIVGTASNGGALANSGSQGDDSSAALIGTNNAGVDSGKVLVKAYGGGGGYFNNGTNQAPGGGGAGTGQ